MKPAPFAYFRPHSLDEALALLAAHGGDAKALAGGQSLVPAMNFRMAQPAVLVDLNRLPNLDGIVADSGSGLALGALVRHQSLERSEVVRQRVPLLSEAMPFVAHPPIRTRGTLGGSLAHADPAAELPAIMLTLGARFELASHAGRRTVAADEFFTGLFSTALGEGELVVGVTIPARLAGEGWAFDEVSRRHGDYALAGAAAVVVLDARERVASARIGLLSVHERTMLATHAAQALVGESPTTAAIATAADAAAMQDADPSSDIHASSAYRRHLTRILVGRVLTRAVVRARNTETESTGGQR